MLGFAKRFKQLRLEKGMTQEELRAEYNKIYHRSYTATAISYYENGKRMPEIDALQDFARYFNVSVSYLLGEIETRNPDSGTSGEPITKPVVDDDLATMLEKIKSLSPEHREKAEEYIDMLKTLDELQSGKNIIDLGKKA